MNKLFSLLSTTLRQQRPASSKQVSEASAKARDRFRHSMLGEPGIGEAIRLFGVGR